MKNRETNQIEKLSITLYKNNPPKPNNGNRKDTHKYTPKHNRRSLHQQKRKNIPQRHLNTTPKETRIPTN